MYKNLAAIAMAACVFSIPAYAQSPEPLKVGFVYVAPVTDAGWVHQHEVARQYVQSSLGERVKTSFVENVPEGPDAERVIRELATTGHKLIFAPSFGYMEPLLKVARDFPDVKFESVTGYKTAANVAASNARYYEGRYLAGIAAGRMTKTNVAGYVAGFPIPEVLQGINAFTLGMRSVNPAAQVKVVWLNAWFDPAKEREAAMTLMNQQADVLAFHTASTAVMTAAQERGKLAIMTAVDAVWKEVLARQQDIAAGRLTKTGVAGYVAGFPIPEVLQGINAFTLGMRSVNPKAQVKVVWLNAWFDPAREREAAMTLFNQDADVLSFHTASTAVMAAAQERGKLAIAYHSDMRKTAPDAQVLAVTHQWGDYYRKRTQAVLDGNWKPSNLWGGVREGMIRVDHFGPKVPKAVQQEVLARQQDIAAGKLRPFAGPIADNAGRTVLPKGQALSDAQILAMDYLVEGVQGKVTK